MDYLQISNTAQKDSAENMEAFLQLTKKDDRVISCLKTSSDSVHINMDLGHNEIVNDVFKITKAAGLLYCPAWQCVLNIAVNKKNMAVLKKGLEESYYKRNAYEDKLVKESLVKYRVTIYCVINLISHYEAGSYFDSKELKRAQALVSDNQESGTGSWFVYTDYYVRNIL